MMWDDYDDYNDYNDPWNRNRLKRRHSETCVPFKSTDEYLNDALAALNEAKVLDPFLKKNPALKVVWGRIKDAQLRIAREEAKEKLAKARREAAAQVKAEAKARVLAKLSPEEAAALGIKVKG